MSSRLEIGFFDTPDKFAAAVRALDYAIQQLKGAAHATPNGGGINAAWRAELDAFVARWELERDEYEPWTARLMLLEPNARLNQFKDAYLWWRRDFETKAKKQLPGHPMPAPQTMSEAIRPDWAWLAIIGLGVLAFAYASGRR